MTLSSEYMNDEKREVFEKELEEYNVANKTSIIHINTTFEELINS